MRQAKSLNHIVRIRRPPGRAAVFNGC
jgi:hypothetical protein